MTHRLATACCVLLSLTLVASAVEVLQNPGFESGTSQWSGISLETIEVYSGSQSGRINQTSFWRMIGQSVDCEPGQIMSFGGYLKSEDIVTSGGGIRVTFYDSGNQAISTISAGSVSGTQDWTYCENTVLVPTATDYAVIQLYVGQSHSTYGQVYFDDLFCDLFSHKEVIINANGGFENGFAGWHKGHASSSSNAYEGVNASAITHGSFWKNSWYEFDCDPSKEYAVSFAAASENATSSGIIQIRYYDSSDSPISADVLLSLSGTNAFAVYYADGIYPPVGADYARFYFSAAKPGAGISYLDDVLISTDAYESSLVSPNFIDQALTNLTPDPGMENGVSDWSGGANVETTVVATGLQAARFDGASFYKSYSHDLIPADEGTYYILSVLAAIENVSISPSIKISFFAADGTTKLGDTDNIIDIEGTAPYRAFSSPYYLSPAGTAYLKISISFPKENSGARLYLDEVNLYESENLSVRLVPTYQSVGVYISREEQIANEVAHVYYRETGTTQWYEAYKPEFDATRGEYRSSIVGLNEATDYEVQVVLEADGIKFDEAGALVATWDSTPTIAQTISVASLYTGGQLLIEDMHGEPDGWIKIVGTGSNDIDGGYADDIALRVLNSSYLIFEGIEIEGGRRHAVQVQMSDQIRIVDCEMSGWARQPNYMGGVYSYETLEDKNKGKKFAINKDAGVHLYESSRVTVERCYMHDPRTSANNWEGRKHPAGPSAIYVQNITGTSSKIMKGNFVVRYNDLIGSDEIRWNDVIEGENNNQERGSFYRDSDIYGNMLAFANDDSTELDGGQMNIRFFGNRIESCYVGLSLAPCIVGPSYVYQNLMFNQGDDRNSCFSIVKLGGGTTYSKGKSFFFNNTIHGKGNGLTSVRFGDDSNYSMFLGQTRNNIIRTTNSNPKYNRTIRDEEQNPWNDFDYDNLSTQGSSTASTEYAAGQEANGILDDAPTFVNAAVGDFRLASGSSGIDDGLGLPNFADQYLGNAPDQGAIEHGDSSMFPIRPIAIHADKYFVELTGVAGGSTTPVDVTLTTGTLSSPLGYEVRMNNTVDWLSVAPATGTLSAHSTESLTLTLQTAGLSAGDKLEATILVKLENGFSVPITVNAEAL
ncbi:hypothetical protein [Puniceicoccus vermicola]|uniref:Right-handed parallel beta-helix repeat-containing protein n=1 Tax=Puniceicoccus vermicola TaxID=388746 RepID=A0A7X1AXD0_9BACT|nr:hypothetical protein [Puniceicoccus vermicola]MBC2601736.1 hypothetical protein [Puniceicoccus vermicola]